MLPSRASDAGPDTRQTCTCCSDDQVQCSECFGWHAKTSSSRCQGAAGGVDKQGRYIQADTCTSYACDGCEVRCWGCNLPVCSEHAQQVDKHVQCETCSMAIACSAVVDLAAALESIPAQFADAVRAIVQEVA